MTAVLKLGGSVITEKDRTETVDDGALAAAADAVAAADRDLVVVHGAGSFGHHHAAERGVGKTEPTRDAGDVTAIHDSMVRLNGAVLAALHEREVPAVAVDPLAAGRKDEAGAFHLDTGSVETLLGEGFVPVLYGDVVAHAGAGVSIASGDDVVVELARNLSADRVGLCSTVPGVLDEDGAVIDRIDSFEAVAAAVGASDATDVTGGMAEKVRTLLDLPVPAFVFGPDDLPAFLDGRAAGTEIRGGR